MPSTRLRHTAVWTGSEMFIWGGCAYSTSGSSCHIRSDAKRYDPTADAWNSVSSAGALPAAGSRRDVWTGDQVIIWNGGGFGGGRYDPASDSWTPMSSANEPPVNNSFSVVWTGQEMIAWGSCLGNCISSADGENIGGRYDPDLDTWTATSTAGAPAPRYLHTVVWTGSEMIVWGGCSGLVCSAVVDTGGRYDPGSDGWTATALAGAPVARAEHSAIWIGDSMIVWGGLTEDGSGIAGGMYYLQAFSDGFDLNCDGAVDILDITLVANRWGCSLGDACFVAGFDLNGDHAISVADVMMVAAQWMRPRRYPLNRAESKTSKVCGVFQSSGEAVHMPALWTPLWPGLGRPRRRRR